MAEAKTKAVVKAKAPAASIKTEAVKTTKKVPAKAAAPKAVAAKPVAPKATAAKAKPAATRVSKAKTLKNVTPEQRYKMICEAAYFKSEKRNFAAEYVHQDWLDAEAEINRMLGK